MPDIKDLTVMFVVALIAAALLAFLIGYVPAIADIFNFDEL